MGRRGPKATPTAILKLRGTHRKGRTRAEPVPKGEAPAPPEWLLPAAREEWERLRPELVHMRLLTAVDWGQFAAYCQCWARWQDAEIAIAEQGTTIDILDKEGWVKYTQISPHVTIAHKCLERLNKLAAEFGLTPSARSRLGAVPVGKEKGDASAAEVGDEAAQILGLGTG